MTEINQTKAEMFGKAFEVMLDPVSMDDASHDDAPEGMPEVETSDPDDFVE